ncbi:hypothetical protein ACFXNW_18365 [Nocardia sp. NPDC059180]|uniref:hypothetical protein n=1 Tax=Nocardia sp. NPDC059180 TaxID=3346761 RepID=UPI0036CAECE9
MVHPVARTRLEQLLRQKRLTIGEFVRSFNRVAAEDQASGKAASVSVSQRQAIRWVTGGMTKLPHPAACRVLEQMFHEPAETLFDPPRITETQLSTELGWANASPAQANPPVPQWQGSQQSTTGRDEIDEATSMAAAESAQFCQFAEQTNVGPHTIEQFHSDLRRIVTVYPNRPVYPLFNELRHLRDRAFRLLEGRQLPKQTRDLYLTAAGLCAVLSNASFDLGNFAAAETQARTAFLAAELAGHNGLRAWIRGTQALIAYWDDRPGTAIDLAESGWRYVPENGTARVRLASIEARARARMRDEVGTNDALQRADQARQATRTPDTFGGMMEFPLAKQYFYGGAARLWLGGTANLADAEQLSNQAVELYETDPPEHRRLGEISLARLDFAVTRLARSDLDGAAEQIEVVLDIGGQRRTESVARRLLQIHSALERPHFQTSTLATSLRERIACSPIRQQPALPQTGETA